PGLPGPAAIQSRDGLSVGGFSISVMDLLDKVNPVTGKMIPYQPPGYRNANHLFSASEKKIRLHAAANECVLPAVQ
ncbi:MAG: hypothetical protein ABR534_16290, partial [Desulfotignum sp.]